MSSPEERNESWSDDALLREASNGNDAAFQQFCVRALPSLLRYCEYQCRQFSIRSRAADFCQEAIESALIYVASCRRSGGRPFPKVSVAWLKQIAYNCILDWEKRERRVELVGEFEGYLEPTIECDKTIEEIEEQEQILKFFSWMKEDDRDLLELVLVKELGIAVAGQRLGLSPDASYKAYQRALQRLADLLAEHGLAPNAIDAE